TRRFYGEADELLGYYAWYRANAGPGTHPVGQLKPNDWGLFDLYGNLSEWCLDRAVPYPAARGGVVGDRLDPSLTPEGPGDWVLRGGACNYPASALRSAQRNQSLFTDDNLAGVRPVRTLPGF